MLSVKLPAEVEDRLERLAKATGPSKSFCARQAIVEHLEVLDDIYLAERRSTDNQTGKSRTYALGEVEREPGMTD